MGQPNTGQTVFTGQLNFGQAAGPHHHEGSLRMTEPVTYLLLAAVGVAGGILSWRLPASGKAAVAGLGGPLCGYYFDLIYC